MILTQSHEGDEELRNLMVGRLLFVHQADLIKIGLIYGAIGLIHWWARKPLLLISQAPQEAFKRGMRVRLWDLLFYTSFGFVVTSSVELAGVLLVFAFLVVPSVCAAWLVHTIGRRLLLGWLLGVATSTAGITVSYVYDLPTGATVVCAFGVCLLVCLLIRGLEFVKLHPHLVSERPS